MYDDREQTENKLRTNWELNRISEGVSKTIYFNVTEKKKTEGQDAIILGQQWTPCLSQMA